MKKYVLIFNFFSLVMSAQNTVSIYGTITNPKSDKVFVRYVKDNLTYDQVIADSAGVDKNGNFSMSFAWKKPFPASLLVGDESTDLFLTPKDSFRIKVDAGKFDSSINYSGVGAIVNNYIAKKLLRNSKVGREKMMASKSMNEKRFTVYIDSIYLENNNFFKEYFSKFQNKTKSITDFMDSELEEINYLWASDKMRYPGYYTYFNKLKEPLEMGTNYYEFLKQVNLTNPKLITSYWYLDVVELYTNYNLKKSIKADTTLKDKEKYTKAKQEFIEKNFTGEVGDLLLAKMAYDLIVYENNIRSGKVIIDKYLARSKSKEYSDNLNAVYTKASKFAPGQPALEFNYADLNGKMVSLKDFRGKVVYLDLWASWCGPCLREIPDTKKLEEELKGKDVVFLCVSVDRDEDAWKKTVKEKEMPGIHLICKGDFESEIAKLYNVKGIPRYILIDKNGKIVNVNANRPSSGVKPDIEKLLN